MRTVALTIALGAASVVPTAAQAPAAPPQLQEGTRTAYSQRTELFAEWRPLIVGEESRLTVKLTRTGDSFKPYVEGTLSLTLTVNRVSKEATVDRPARPGVFGLSVTPTTAGTGRIVIDVIATTVAEHFVIDNVPVYADLRAALVNQPEPEAGLVSYPKERSWEEEFATAPVSARFGGAARIFMIPMSAIVHAGVTALVYVQRTPERFELREVRTRRTLEGAVEITSGLRDGERIVVRGADRMPRK